MEQASKWIAVVKVKNNSLSSKKTWSPVVPHKHYQLQLYKKNKNTKNNRESSVHKNDRLIFMRLRKGELKEIKQLIIYKRWDKQAEVSFNL